MTIEQNIPIPDPSTLTLRAMEELKADLRREFADKRREYSEKLDSLKNYVDIKIAGLSELAEAERRSADAAIQKSESAFQRELISIKDLMRESGNTYGTQFANLSDRIGRSEAADRAVKESRVEGHMTIGSVIGIVSGVVGVISLMFAIIMGISGHSSGSVNVIRNPLPLPPASALNGENSPSANAR